MKIVSRTRENVTMDQVHVLLSVLNNLTPYLLAQHRDVDSMPELDGGVASAAQLTAIKVCDRITEIVNDPSRWSMKQHDSLEQALARMYQSNNELLQITKGATAMRMSPAAMHSPTVTRTNDGRFCAFIGDPERPATFIFGVGATIEQALQDFNYQFRMTPDQVNTLTPGTTPESASETPVNKPKTPRKRKDQQL